MNRVTTQRGGDLSDLRQSSKGGRVKDSISILLKGRSVFAALRRWRALRLRWILALLPPLFGPARGHLRDVLGVDQCAFVSRRRSIVLSEPPIDRSNLCLAVAVLPALRCKPLQDLFKGETRTRRRQNLHHVVVSCLEISHSLWDSGYRSSGKNILDFHDVHK